MVDDFTDLEKAEDGEYHCPKCDGVLVVRPGLFYWRGKSLSGLYCAPCNAMWNNPADSFYDAVRESAGGGSR